jgi:hypothetical protein
LFTVQTHLNSLCTEDFFLENIHLYVNSLILLFIIAQIFCLIGSLNAFNEKIVYDSIAQWSITDMQLYLLSFPSFHVLLILDFKPKIKSICMLPSLIQFAVWGDSWSDNTSECKLTTKTVSFITQDKKIWKGKHMEDKEFKVSLYAKNKKCQWYIDNGCSKYMT